MIAFLKANGRVLDATEAGATRVMVGVAAGDIAETELADWLARHCRPC